MYEKPLELQYQGVYSKPEHVVENVYTFMMDAINTNIHLRMILMFLMKEALDIINLNIDNMDLEILRINLDSHSH